MALRAARLLHRVTIASLNYECVLDVAASRGGVPVAYGSRDGRPPPGNLLILKPHGACNLVPTANVSGMTIQLAGGETGFFDGQLEVLPSLRAVHERYEQGFALPPAMSMYTRNKHSPVGRSFLEASRRQWSGWVRGCSAVLCVGARPVMWDQHIWRPIIDRQAPTWFVGGRDASYVELNTARAPWLDVRGWARRDREASRPLQLNANANRRTHGDRFRLASLHRDAIASATICCPPSRPY